MIVWLRHVLGWLSSTFRARADLVLENLALRQQLLALHARDLAADSPYPRSCSGLGCEGCGLAGKEPLVLVTPRTVAGWHRAGFRALLEMAFKSQVEGRSQAGEQRGSRLSFD